MGATMKRITYVGTSVIVLAGMFAGRAAAQSEPLGDYARQVRNEKKEKPEAAKKYDNDNLPTTDKLSIVGNAPEEPSAPAAESTSAQPAEEKPGQEAKPESKSGVQ